jgi:hypothetical protein
LDRCLIVRLERISEEDRLTEEELETLTLSLLPGIYGALLDLLVVALRNLPTTQPARLPRMADFARLGLAAKIPNFMETYVSNIEVGSQAAVEASPLAAGILSLLDTCNGYWHGTTTELIRKLQELDPTSKDFQKLSARSVGRKLASCLKGDLASVGVEVDQGKSTNGQRYLILSRVVEPQTPTPSLDKEEEEQSPPIALPSVTPEKNNGAAVPTTPEEKKTPATATTDSSPPISKQDDRISRWRWNSLLDACVKAEVSYLQVREVLAEACGCSKHDVERIPLTWEQYRRALNYLANYQNGATAAAPTNGKAHDFSSPPITSTQTRLPVSPLDNGNGHSSHNSHSLDSAEIGLPLAHEGIPPWLWEG